MRVWRLSEVQRARTSITVGCTLDDLSFHVTVWYEDIDLHELAQAHGDDLLDRLAVHIALFQLNAVASLRPDVIDLGPWAKHLTPELATLWKTVSRHVWAQWRWENQQPDYMPEFATSPVAAPATPAKVPDGPVELLAFCGGGKDSLVTLRLLERAGLPFSTLAYSHSIYGRAAEQHALIDRVAGVTGRARAERQWIVEDLLDSPVLRLRPDLGVKTLTAAETPASVFTALPLALARGYRGLVVGHEASANAPNLEWNGEGVNHQWGKSFEAERLLDSYVQQNLFSNVRYFSLLAPVHDEVIFELLAEDAPLAPLTHSCNVQKPWCGRCAKCAYVWLQFAAHLPADIVGATFCANLGERAENDLHFRELLGLAEHSPFECVGSPMEARLAAALARQKGSLGPRLSALADAAGPVDFDALGPLVSVSETHALPRHVAARVMPFFRQAARAAAERLGVTT
jgi:hypothetical protein